MREPDLLGLLTAAQSRVRGARAILARPRSCNLDQCVTLFREAQGYLEWICDSLPRTEPSRRNLRREAAALAGEIGQAGLLLEQAARLGRRWLEGLRSRAPEYTASGTAVPLHIRGRISCLG